MVRREVAVRQLQQQQVAILRRVAQVGELVLVVPGAFELGRAGIEAARLAEQVEPHIGERDVLLGRRPVAAPFRQAVPGDQRVVGAAQREQHQRRLVRR